MNSVLAIGLMSGTSMDGVDAALIETDGDSLVRTLDFASRPYSDGERAVLRAAMERALSMETPGEHAEIASAAALLDHCHVEAVRTLLAKSGRRTSEIHVIGYHGQTVAHRPDRGWTWQIGNGQALADAFALTVVDDFRSADVAQGGQGAPLVPAYHAALLAGREKPAVVLNLGGVGNVTFVDADGGLLAFDTGPANALIDDWVGAQAGLSHDAGGAIAAQGVVDEAVLAGLMDNQWFAVRPPKSLDRNDFSMAPVEGLSLADGAATLAAFTAAAVAAGLDHCPARPRAIHVAGGGRHNRTLMDMISTRCGVPAQSVDDLGWNGDATEAEAFAYLAVRVLRGQPTSYPETTGVHAPVSGGRINRSQSLQSGGVLTS